MTSVGYLNGLYMYIIFVGRCSWTSWKLCHFNSVCLIRVIQERVVKVLTSFMIWSFCFEKYDSKTNKVNCFNDHELMYVSQLSESQSSYCSPKRSPGSPCWCLCGPSLRDGIISTPYMDKGLRYRPRIPCGQLWRRRGNNVWTWCVAYDSSR